MTKSKTYNQTVRFDDKEHEALMGVWWTGILLKKQAKHFFSDFLSSEVQFNIMMVLKYAEQPLTQNEIGERLLVDKSNITGMLDRMEKSGLLRRVSVPGDRRCYNVQLTAAGLDILEKVEGPYRDYIKDLMAIFQPEELDHLAEYMVRMQQAITTGNINPLSR